MKRTLFILYIFVFQGVVQEIHAQCTPDTTPPTCNAPADAMTTCEAFDPTLAAYGTATATDNCCTPTVGITINYSLFDTVCNKGTLRRFFTATDCAGNATVCTQTIIVEYIQNYFVRFPDDVIASNCDPNNQYGAPQFFGEDCELMGVSYQDVVNNVVPDACFAIHRTWLIINWCTYNPNLPFISIPNPQPSPIINHPSNLPGPIVSACGTPAPWTATVVKIHPTDPTPTDYCTFWDQNANGYQYEQIIKVIDSSNPTINCPASPVDICDLTMNSNELWNESYWWENAISQHNKCEAPADLSITASDNCSPADLTFQYLLFLDLDQDGTMETVVNSASPPPANTVYFNNVNTPGYTGGTPRAFDERMVSPNDKYGFSIEVTQSGNNRIAHVRWNTPNAPASYTVPELPYGTHKIKWFVTDGCGNQNICEYIFNVKDCLAPTVACLYGLSVNLQANQQVTVWGTDFLNYAEDNCTPSNQITLGVRRQGTGAGFPTGQPNITFTCADAGTSVPIELWGKDVAGNAGFCTTFIIIQDNGGNCGGNPPIPPPANDDCAGAINLGTLPYCANTAYTNLGATPSNIGANNIPSCFNNAAVNADVWFKFTAPSGGPMDYVIKVNGQGISGPQIALYTGTCAPDGFTEIACAQSNILTVNGLIPGLVYYLRIDSDAGCGAGAFTLCIDPPATANTAGFSAQQLTVPKLSSVAVPIQGTAASIGGFQYTITFDPSIIQYTGLSNIALPGFGPSNVNAANAANGEIGIVWTSQSFPVGVNLPANSQLFSLNFTGIGNVGQVSPVTFTGSPVPVEAVSGSLELLNTSFVNGSVTITDPLVDTLTLLAPDLSVISGKTLHVPITVDHFNIVSGLQFTLHWDPAVLSFIGTSAYNSVLNLSGANFFNQQTAQGNLSFLWGYPTLPGISLSDGSVLFYVDFNVIGAAGTTSPLNFVAPIDAIDDEFNSFSIGAVNGLVQVISPALKDIYGNIHRYGGAPIPDVTVDLVGSSPNIPLLALSDLTDGLGDYRFEDLEVCGNFTITPTNLNEPKTCVSVLDLLRIYRHILGIEPFNNPYDMIAADANKSGSITTFDIVELRKLILCQYTQLPNNSSWRFVSASFVFPNPTNPFQTQFPESATVNPLIDDTEVNFIGAKIGDVNNCSENPLPAFLHLTAGNVVVPHGQVVEVPVTVQNFNNVAGLQFSMSWDPALIQFVEVNQLASIPSLTTQNVFSNNGTLSFAWINPNGGGTGLADNTVLFKIRFTAIGPGNTVSPLNFVNMPAPFQVIDGQMLAYGLNYTNGSVAITCPTPMPLCPPDVYVNTDPGYCNAVVNNIGVTGLGNACPVTLNYSIAGASSGNGLNDASGQTFNEGVSVITYTATDADGHTGSCWFMVTVEDHEPPVLTNCPPNIVVNNTPGNCGSIINYASPTASDNCGLAGLNANYPSGSFFQVGTTILVFTATDINGNSATCSALVTVNDTEPPVLSCVNNLFLGNDPGLCSKLVLSNVLDANAVDNCGGIFNLHHDYNASPNHLSLAGTNFPVGVTNVVWSATDASGNIGSCLQQVTIQDTQLPTFLNCPTQLLMVGNDVDQCAAKVNWPDPVAWDNCGAPNVMQFSGPLSGTSIPVSPLPDTIKYRATDASGNSAVCTFLVRVIDTQLPSINANVSIPANITVDCNAVPPPFVLTANDVHDNCTAPQNIGIAFTQTMTQNNNPGTCGFYTFQIIRTWKITDAAGNMRAYTQVISVQDTQKPTAVCKNINLTLDDFGNASITPQQLDGGSSDNCTPAANLLFTASKTAFNCAQLGSNTVTFTVTDLCGNTSTCTAIVTVLEGNGKCNPTYDVNGSDPCVCLNNATTLTDGQFSELIQIQALAGQIWSVASHTGLFAPNSPNPPNAPLPIPNGALLTNGLSDGLDNDHDGSTDETDERVYYTLRARHVDAQGYTAVLSAGAGLQLNLSNKCYYPTPYFSNLTDPFCLNTAPFNIAVNEINNAQGTVSIKVNGVTTNIFNAAALGVGFHTVTATFDAGSAQPFSTENGITVNGSEAAAQADPGCQQTISKVVQVVGTPTTVVCNDLVYVSLDADCMETLNADDVLEGTYLCYDDYTVEIDKTLPYGNGPWLPGTVNASDIGKTYFYHVVHPISGNVCWGQIKIEDKLAPALTCPPNITIACSEPTDAQHTGNVTAQDCSATSTVLDDTYTDFGLCSSPRSQIVRAFIVTDAWGNQASCSQTITITPFDLATVVFPADITLNCETTYLNPAALAPINTGRPTINGASILGSVMCGAKVNYTDTYYQGCEGTYTILRAWNVLNDCLPVGPGNPITHTQRIKVDDFGGPVFDCPAAVTVSTDPTQCCATAALPDMIISEGCSHIADLEAKVTGTNPANGNIITFTVSGHLGDFPGNNYWTPDTLAIFPYTQCLPVGVYTVQYTAADQCGHTSKCAFQMTVADLVPPVAACDQWTQVDLGGNGMAFVDAATFDDGSHDNCAPVEFKVRRMQPNDCQSDTLFYDQVKFCCSDIDDTMLVVFRVYDVDVPAGTIGLEAYEGRYNDCMVQVLVKDKIKPTCNPPANVTVDCENFDPGLWAYGTATAEDNCCIDTLTATANYALFDTVCNRGTITRTFRAYDCAGLTSQCTQRVIVNYLQDYYVKFPNDVIVTVCDGTGLFGEPTFFGKDCELLGISFEDQIFTVVPDACFEIERTWKIINWCTFNPNVPLTEVPNPNPNATSGSPQNLPGPIVSAPGTLAPWTATVVKVLPTDPVATNFSVFWAANNNGYTYKQIIKILDTQDPTAENCPDTLVTFCDVTPNDPLLWRDNFWWDDLTALHDLCEGPTDLTITATDACSGSNINIHYLLFLDMDKDGTMETVINSANTGIVGLGWNAVPFGNAANPNYTGGSIHPFDNRAVPFNQKYGFTIQTTAAGTKKTASVRWNTQLNQNNFVVPELPYGKHKIKWIIEDGCGNESVCEYTFEVKDCKKPSVVCLNGLTVNIMPSGMVTLWDADFLQYADDNCTPAGKIKTAIRRSGTGTGFPLDGNGNPVMNVNFTCDDLGTQTVELWGRDLAGNAGYCETYVIVQDNAGNCIPDSAAAKVAGQLITETDDGVEEGVVQISGSGTAIPNFTFSTMSSSQGWYNFNAIPKASNSVVTPLKDDNPLNGVSTYDLVLISKHILGVEPLNTPYKMIAADANNSNSITTFDVVELRKLILGIYADLPTNTSWRFVDKSFVFPNPGNPFQTQFPETKLIADIQSNHLAEDFVSVKVGDVNGTVIPNSLVSAHERSVGTLLFDVNDQSVRAGETFTVALRPAQASQGYQFTLNTKDLEVIDVTGVKGENYAVFAGATTFSVDGADAQSVVMLTLKATKAGKVSELLSISSRITKAEAYKTSNNEQGTRNVERYDIGLRFNKDGVQTISGVGFELYQNQPNPFVNKTVIGFHLPPTYAEASAGKAQAGDPNLTTATLSIYDETGRTVFKKTGNFPQGYNAITIDRALLNTTGLLYYKLETARDSAMKKMIRSK